MTQGPRARKIKGQCNYLNLFERLSCWKDIRFIRWPQRAKTEPTGWKLRVRNISIKKEFSDRARVPTNGNASGVKKEGREERRKQRLLYRSNNILWFLWKVGSSFLPWFNFAADCFIVLGKNNTPRTFGYANVEQGPFSRRTGWRAWLSGAKLHRIIMKNIFHFPWETSNCVSGRKIFLS